ncbi:MAG: PRC-barrel domain-containing protein [Roseinatronobacter sp.]
MKKMMMTTALVAVTSMGAYAQTAATDQAADPQVTADAGMAQNGMTVPAFLVSDFTSMNLYTLDTEATRALSDQRMAEDQSAWDRTRMRWESSETFSATRDQWENVGNIDDVVLSQDGQVRGVLIDVGGFLGIGARTVLVDIEDLYFVVDDANPEDIDDFFVVATMTEEQLEALPEWNEDQLQAGFAARDMSAVQSEPGASMGHDETSSAATTGTEAMDVDAETRTADVPEGYRPMSAEEQTADRLMGADVFGREGEEIATVDDFVIGDTGEITHVIMDVGGFLGMASHTVAIETDDLDILWNDADGDVRVQVTMTQEEMESLPEYEG